MKKLTLLFTIVIITFSSFAQEEFDNKVYTRIGYANAIWEPVSRETDDWIDGYNKY